MNHYKMKVVFIFSAVLFFSSGLWAQKLSTKSKKATSFYQDALKKANGGSLDQAISSLKEALKEDKYFIEARIMLGEMYIDNQQDSLAIESLKSAIELSPDFFPGLYSNLANLEFNNGRYDEGLAHVRKYLAYPNQNPQFRKDAEVLMKSCEFAANAIQHPVPFNPRNLGAEINNKYDQYWPSLSADDQSMVFTEKLPIDPQNPEIIRNRQEDFYASTFNNGRWAQAQPVGPPLNTPGNEGAQSISADGKLMIFTGCNRRDGFGNCDLYFSRKVDDKWTVPQNMGKPVNSPAKETQPSISPDSKTIYFASTRAGGKGGLDIWKSTLTDDGNWGEPVNLGDSVNTPYDDQSPFIHPDNHTLYFSSKGWPGMGGFDLFMSRQKGENQWTTPRNLGYPINTHFQEIGIIVNAEGNTAYYSSNRLGGEGGDDIYAFELYKEVRPTRVSYMKGNVFDAETTSPLTARFELIDLASSKNIMDAFSNDDGSFLICLPEGKDYALNVNRKGYLFYSDNFTMSHGDFAKPYLKDVPLKPIKVGETVVMKNVFFDSDSYELKSESKFELDRLVKLLKENPALQIEISGHTDNSGKIEYNNKLSENRARKVAEYLVKNGADIKMITSKGYGALQPIAPNTTEEGKAQNRRTEFKVLKIAH
jgi:outer membrane protein OmpA-like peptidoglycan-associated protein/tetratricopeptide (TPR) repeat protein